MQRETAQQRRDAVSEPCPLGRLIASRATNLRRHIEHSHRGQAQVAFECLHRRHGIVIEVERVRFDQVVQPLRGQRVLSHSLQQSGRYGIRLGLTTAFPV